MPPWYGSDPTRPGAPEAVVDGKVAFSKTTKSENEAQVIRPLSGNRAGAVLKIHSRNQFSLQNGPDEKREESYRRCLDAKWALYFAAGDSFRRTGPTSAAGRTRDESNPACPPPSRPQDRPMSNQQPARPNQNPWTEHRNRQIRPTPVARFPLVTRWLPAGQISEIPTGGLSDSVTPLHPGGDVL